MTESELSKAIESYLSKGGEIKRLPDQVAPPTKPTLMESVYGSGFLVSASREGEMIVHTDNEALSSKSVVADDNYWSALNTKLSEKRSELPSSKWNPARGLWVK